MPISRTHFGYGTGGFGEGGYGAIWGQGPGPGYYRSLITSEYQLSTKFVNWVSSVLTRIDDVNQTLAGFHSYFDLDVAIGAQLDIVGSLVGVQRVVPFQPSGGVSPTLDDTTFRILIRAKIAANQWDGRIDSLQGIWQILFPGGTIVLTDSQDMTVSVILAGAFSSITQDLITHGMIVPRPEGVLYNYVFSTLPIFGFDTDNTYIAGFDKGHWA